MNRLKSDFLKASLVTTAILTISIFVLGVGGLVVQAWTDPSGTPPTSDDIAAPLNVSGNLQEKAGQLQIDPINKESELNADNALSVYGLNNDHTAIYAENGPAELPLLPYEGYAAYFSHSDKDTPNPDPQAAGLPEQMTGGYATIVDGNMKITGDLIILGSSASGVAAGKRGVVFPAFQCERDAESCGIGAQESCNEKCANATVPGAGYCSSAWTSDKGVLSNFTCDDTSTPAVTVLCNCLTYQ